MSLGKVIDPETNQEVTVTPQEAVAKFGKKAFSLSYTCAGCGIKMKLGKRKPTGKDEIYFLYPATRCPGHSKDCNFKSKVVKDSSRYSSNPQDMVFGDLVRLLGVGKLEKPEISRIKGSQSDVKTPEKKKLIEEIPEDVYGHGLVKRKTLPSWFDYLSNKKDFLSGDEPSLTLDDVIINRFNWEEFEDGSLKIEGAKIVPCLRRMRDKSDPLFIEIIERAKANGLLKDSNPNNIILLKSIFSDSIVLAVNLEMLSEKRKKQFFKKFFCLVNNKSVEDKTNAEKEKEEKLKKERKLVLLLLEWEDLGFYGNTKIAFGTMTALRNIDYMAESRLEKEYEDLDD